MAGYARSALDKWDGGELEGLGFRFLGLGFRFLVLGLSDSAAAACRAQTR